MSKEGKGSVSNRGQIGGISFVQRKKKDDKDLKNAKVKIKTTMGTYVLALSDCDRERTTFPRDPAVFQSERVFSGMSYFILTHIFLKNN